MCLLNTQASWQREVLHRLWKWKFSMFCGLRSAFPNVLMQSGSEVLAARDSGNFDGGLVSCSGRVGAWSSISTGAVTSGLGCEIVATGNSWGCRPVAGVYLVIALQRKAKLTGERLRVFVVLNVSCGSAENYHAGTGGGRSFRREQVCLYRYGGMGTFTH